MGFNFKGSDNKLQKQAKYAPAKRHTAKWQWYLLVLIILTPVFYFAYKFLSYTFIPKAEGNITFEKIELKAPLNSYIKKIYVKQGEKVKKKQTLVLLDYPELSEDIIYLTKEIEFLQKKKESSENPELKHLQEFKVETENYLVELNQNYEHLKKLRLKGLSTFLELQESRVDLNEGRVQVYNIEKTISESNYKYDLKIEELYDAKIRKLNSELEKAKRILEGCTIKAPQNGIVVDVNVNNKEYVSVGKELLVLATDENMHVKAYLPSRFLSKGIQEGIKVELKFPNNFKKEGIIYKIKKQAELHPNISSVIKEEKNRVVILIRIIGNLPVKYKIFGLPVEVSFDFLTPFK